MTHFSNRSLSATLGAALIIANAAASTVQTPTLAPDCDIWLRAAEACLAETGQLTAAKQNALRIARDEMATLSGGSEDDGPRQRLNAQAAPCQNSLPSSAKCDRDHAPYDASSNATTVRWQGTHVVLLGLLLDF